MPATPFTLPAPGANVKFCVAFLSCPACPSFLLMSFFLFSFPSYVFHPPLSVALLCGAFFFFFWLKKSPFGPLCSRSDPFSLLVCPAFNELHSAQVLLIL